MEQNAGYFTREELEEIGSFALTVYTMDIDPPSSPDSAVENREEENAVGEHEEQAEEGEAYAQEYAYEDQDVDEGMDRNADENEDANANGETDDEADAHDIDPSATVQLTWVDIWTTYMSEPDATGQDVAQPGPWRKTSSATSWTTSAQLYLRGWFALKFVLGQAAENSSADMTQFSAASNVITKRRQEEYEATASITNENDNDRQSC
ncbi:hypothetical protein F4802DRAFT_615791 [Xylaria palmicola]|nr:hypothetical protein F4802DRAFT_615791 [Xylaria palmicola]